jgi:trimeric autotransporter adhesin
MTGTNLHQPALICRSILTKKTGDNQDKRKRSYRFLTALCLMGILLFGANSMSFAQSFDNGSPQTLTICQDVPFASLDAMLTASFPGAGLISWSIASGPANGTLNGFPAFGLAGTSVSPTGTSYTPNAGFSGTDAFMIEVTDGTNTASTVINVTVTPIPAGITGTTTVCQGATTSLTDASLVGTWTSDNTAVATVDASGTVSGISGGTATITYSTGCGTDATQPVSVTPIPAGITGTTTVCQGATTSLTDASLTGTWTSDNTAIATVDASGSVSGISGGTATITYSTGCGTDATQPVSVTPIPAGITGTTTVCQGATTALTDASLTGTWTSDNTAVATVDASGTVSGMSGGTATITYSTGCGTDATQMVSVTPIPAGITGVATLCEGTSTSLTDASLIGTWTSDNTAVATVDASGMVSGISGGAATITYSTGCGIDATQLVSVTPIPAGITGAAIVCQGATTNLTDASMTGIWTSGNTAIATVNASGTVTGISGGTAIITYSTGCGTDATQLVSVTPIPAGITGTATLCGGTTTSLTDASLIGTWTSGNTAIATVDASGTVTGISGGTATITYSTGCGTDATQVVNINPAPSPISGPSRVCFGSTIALSDAGGGTWSSSDATVSVDATSGNVTGLSVGFATIVYTLPTGCFTTSGLTISPLPFVFTVTGGGTFCEGDSVHVGLSGSDAGISYQLYAGTSTAGSPVLGTFFPVDFGWKKTAGVYKVIATDTLTGCTSKMADSAIITVNPMVIDSVSIITTPGNHFCAGQVDTLMAIPVNPGTSPFYQWYVNGAKQGTNSPVFTHQLSDKDLVAVNMVSNANCLVKPGLVLAELIVHTNPVFIPIVTINGTANVSKGAKATLTATVANAGPAPTYEWLRNGKKITGATSAVYTDTFSNKDSVTVVVMGTGPCSYPSFNSIIMKVGGTGVQQLSDELSLVVMPNPNKGAFTIRGTFGQDEALNFEVTNLLGQVVYHDALTAQNGEIMKQVQLENNMASGIYLLNIHSASGSKVFRIAVEK